MPTLTDFPDPMSPRAATPSSQQSPSRRETILSLVEMLLKQGENSAGLNQSPSFEDDRDVPTVDEHLQVVGAEAFNKFQKRIEILDKELRNFANAARQLGSSVAILSSSYHLRERLAQILFLYHENAAGLFPRKVMHVIRETPPDTDLRGHPMRSIRTTYKAPPHVSRPTVHEHLDPECFPDQLEALAKDVTTFLHCLNEFPEFTDEAVNASILSFKGDLMYWASCLKEYQGQFRYPAVQKYIHDLSIEMGEHFDNITSTLSMFIEIGVPTIRFAQKHGAANLLNLSTVATFFSAVTATTLQFSYALPRNPISDSVNVFWFASMVFSIGAAVNSLLGLTWKQAMYRSPGHRVPWWVLIWIKRSPLVFLVLSVACFSVGLCCFAYASQQAHVTSTITTVLTAFTSFGLAAVSAWFASERWIFLRHRGKKWLSDVLIEFKNDFINWPGISSALKGFEFIDLHFNELCKSILRLYTSITTSIHDFFKARKRNDDLESSAPPTIDGTQVDENRAVTFSKFVTLDELSPILVESPRPLAPPSSPSSPISEKPEGANFAQESGTTKGKQLWINAMRTVKMRTLMSTPSKPLGANFTRIPTRQRTTSSNLTNFTNLTGSHPERKKTVQPPGTTILKSRVAALVPKIVVLEPIEDLAAHQALVRHIQFSPDGRYLATSSWDRTSVIFKVGDPFVSHRTLAHPQGFVGQVAWSPMGQHLLTKLPRGMKLWTEDGVCKKTIDRNASVESITWFPGGEAFISVEGSSVTKLDLVGNVLDQYHFGRMKLHDVAVTPDSLRLVGVGPLLESPTGLQPKKSRPEKRLVVYNMETKQIENQTPVLNDVRDITLAQNSRNGLLALVSYEDKAPPQLWKLEMLKDRETKVISTRLTLRHTYLPKVAIDFAGPSYFGGKNNELVLCAGKAGDIHIWDQESGALLHHVRAQAHGGDLTCIAWNHAAEDPFMFATGSHDGALRIWSQPLDDPGEPQSPTTIPRSRSPFHFGEMSRSSSPVFQDDTESLHSRGSSPNNSSGTLLKDRVVSFAASPSPEGQ